MRETILKFGEQFAIGAKAAESISIPLEKIKPTLENVVMVGIGGSAIPGKILKSLYQWVKIRECGSEAYNNIDLVIAVSWSGNPVETIQSYKLALEQGLETLAVTTGGQLAQLAKEHEQKLILLPREAIQPRLAVGYMTGALFQALSLKHTSDLKFDTNALEKQGQELAKKIQNLTPLVYSLHNWRNSAEFWKTSFNENSKIHAFSNILPVLEHNELAGFNDRDRSKYFVIILKDPSAGQEENKEIDWAVALLDKIGYNYNIVNLSGETSLEKVLNNYILALWTSYYLAEFLGVDPEDTSVIERFKKLRKTVEA